MKRHPWNTIRAGWLVAMLFWCSPATGSADTQIRLNPLLAVQEDYRSNVLFTAQDREEDFVTVLAPKLEGWLEGDRARGEVSLGIEHELYARQDGLDATNQLYSLSGSVDASERWAAGADASFNEDHSIEREVTALGIAVDRHRRRLWTAEPFVSVALGERTSLAPRAIFTWGEYRDPALRDYRTEGGALRFTRELADRKTTVSAEVGGSRWDYDPESVTSGNFLASLEHAFSDTLTVEGALGYRYLRQSLGEVEEDHALEAVFRMFKEFRPLSLELIASRGVITSPVGAAIQQNRANMTLSLNPYEPLAFYFVGHWVGSDSLLSGSEIDSDVFQGTPGLAWLLGRRLVAELYYRFLHLSNHSSGNEIDGHIVAVAVRLQWQPVEDIAALPFEGMRYGTHDL
ncbi:MAG: hypothetical protein AB1640_10030 [bacterium]